MPEKSDKEKITYARPQNRHAHPRTIPTALQPYHHTMMIQSVT